MKITKNYLKQVINEEMQKLVKENLNEAFYQGGGQEGEAAPEDLQATTDSQYGLPKGDRGASAAKLAKQKTDTKAKATSSLSAMTAPQNMEQFNQKISNGDTSAELQLVQKLKLYNNNLGNKNADPEDLQKYKAKIMDILNYVNPQNGTLAGSSKAYNMIMAGSLNNLKFIKDAIIQKSQNKYGVAQSKRKEYAPNSLRAKLNPSSAQQMGKAVPQKGLPLTEED